MIDGWYTDEELALLAKACRAAPKGLIVEIGVYRGRSAAVLAENRGGRDLFLLDDLSMEGADQAQWPTGEHIFHLTGTYSCNVLFDDTDYIALLHQDAGHDYDTVLWHLKWYGPSITRGGLVALHDFHSTTYPDVQRAWNDYAGGTRWDGYGRAGTLQVWRKP